MAMAAAGRRVAALLRGSASSGSQRRFFAAKLETYPNVKHEMEEMQKWKRITIGMVSIATAYFIYVKSHPDHPPPREKEWPYMSVHKRGDKGFPWGPEPLIGLPKHDHH